MKQRPVGICSSHSFWYIRYLSNEVSTASRGEMMGVVPTARNSSRCRARRVSSGSIRENTPVIRFSLQMERILSRYPGSVIRGTRMASSASYSAGARLLQSVAYTRPFPASSFLKYCTTLLRVPALKIRRLISINYLSAAVHSFPSASALAFLI